MRIALAATGRLGMSLMAGLEPSSHQIVLCVQDGRKTRGIARWLRRLSARLPGGSSVVLGRALRMGVPVLWLDTMSEAEIAPLRELEVDVLLVGGFGIILKEPLLSTPRVGCVNTHSSLLPRHRGPNPFAAAVLAGDTETGVTFHGIDAGIDTGPILDQTAFAVGPRDTAAAVYRKACDAARDRVAEVLDRIARDGIAGRPQPEGEGGYDKRVRLEDAEIDWSQPAEAIDRRIRGLSGTQPAWFRYRGRRIEIVRAHFDDGPAKAPPGMVVRRRPNLVVATGSGRLHIRVAYSTGPLRWIWPMPWNRPRIGQRLTETGSKLTNAG